MSRNSTPSSEDFSRDPALSLDEIIAARPQTGNEDTFRLVYTILREVTGDQTLPRYQFIWSDDSDASSAIWADDERLKEYLQEFDYAGLNRRASHVLEVTLVPENGHMPMGTDLSRYVFVTVDKLHKMVHSPDIITSSIVPIIDIGSNETITTNHDSLSSLLSIEEEEEEDDEDDEEDCECDDETVASAAGSSSSAPEPFRFPDLPSRGLHSFNLFLPPVYAIGQLIGQGEFSKVYVAVNLETEGIYAVKMFRPRKSAIVTEQIVREVETLKGLDCQNILKVAETILHGDHTFMIMELMRRGDLRVHINKHGHLLEGRSWRFFMDLLNGVNYIHRRNIVHLDLKLENLLLDDNLNLKITDFGCARLQIGMKCFSHPCGSYAYGAPEVISGSEFDGKKADAWSMGVILFSMVMARLPFNDKQQELGEMLKERQRVPPILHPVSSHCVDLVTRLLTYSKERRPSVHSIMTHRWVQSVPQ